MNPVDRMFRWTFNLFIFLLCFQLGVILFIFSALQKARKDQKAKEPEVAFACGDFDNDESYFALANSGESLRTCLHQECPDSMWVHKSSNQAEELHVVSIEKPLPAQKNNPELGNGHSVALSIKNMDKPYNLVLITQQDLTVWNLEVDEPEKLKKTIVLSPGLAWIEGLASEAVIEHFPKETICAYPTSWEEIKNPNNQFRRLQRVLKEHTSLDITSFQGKKVGRFFSLPMMISKRELGGRQLASDVRDLDLGLQFQRKEKRMEVSEFHYTKYGQTQKMPLPAKTQDAFFDLTSKRVYLISDYRFGYWDEKKKRFQKIFVPLQMPDMHWPTAMALDERRRQIMVYNDERGGEVYIYNITEKTWRYMGSSVGYTLATLTYNEKDDAFYGARLRGRKITEIVKLNFEGKILATHKLAEPYDFSRSLWRMQLAVDSNDLWLKLYHPAQPKGDLYSLKEVRTSL